MFDIAPDVPNAVLGDPGRLRQILVNIIVNAIKFTDQGEIVLRIVCASRDGDQMELHLSVRDTGIGIPRSKLGAIFDAFSQEDSSTTRKYGGTGLGLTICARLVAAMGGRIWVDSEVGKGSAFHFTLKLEHDRSAAATNASVVRSEGCQVLIVDDNAVNRLVLSRSLEAEGIITFSVASGQEALDWLADASLRGARCDLVLLDAQMPGMDGFTVAPRILQMPRYSKVPIVMLSSAGIKGDARRASDVGIVGYLSKPIARDELLQALGRVLNLDSEPPQDLVTSHSIRESQVLLNVLLVEDHAINQKLAVTLLERWGHHVEVASNGQIALEMAANQQFDVILMDMMMPIMDGLEATRHLRAAETGRRTPIIAMTANAMASDRDRCLAAGMDDYISKPIKAPELKQMLQHHAVGHALAPQSRPAALASASQRVKVFDYAAAMTQVDQEVLGLIAQAFVQQWPDDLAKMRAGLESGDLQVVLHIAHALKGTLSMFGAKPASDLAHQIEKNAMRSDASGVGECLPALVIEMDRLIPVIPLEDAV